MSDAIHCPPIVRTEVGLEHMATRDSDGKRAHLTEPGITVIEQPAEEIGRQAFSCLLARMKAPKLPITKIVLSGNCLVRSSSTEQLKHAR